MTSSFSFDSQHNDMIHDAQYDYYGKRLATCSSDKIIKIFDVANNAITPVTDLVGHEGPVWAVSWAHPKFGIKLASTSYDRKVIVWSEERGVWTKSYIYSGSDLSVNSISWAPHEVGLVLVCGSSDGTVSVLTQNSSNEWSAVRFEAHKKGVSAVSWAPSSQPLSLSNGSGTSSKTTPRFVSGGFDNSIKIWSLEHGSWSQEGPNLDGHGDWVRDVSWSPNVGLPYSTIASCSQDGYVKIWTQINGGAWTSSDLKSFEGVVWRVSWSVTGNILAVSSGDNIVTLWKETLDHEWKCISSLTESEQSV
jgi:protein transport protein SEC13